MNSCWEVRKGQPGSDMFDQLFDRTTSYCYTSYHQPHSRIKLSFTKPQLLLLVYGRQYNVDGSGISCLKSYGEWQSTI